MGKSNRWWIIGTNFRTWKKHLSKGTFEARAVGKKLKIHSSDGNNYTVKMYDKVMNMLGRLSVGDPIWNGYLGRWETIKVIHISWDDIQYIKFISDESKAGYKLREGRIIGTAVSGMYIITDSDAGICDIISHFYDDRNTDEETSRKFNLIVGLPENQKTFSTYI